MAEPETKKVEAPKGPTDAEILKLASEKLVSIKAQLKSFEGKEGYNPYLWSKTKRLALMEDGLSFKSIQSAKDILALPATVNCSVDTGKELKNIVKTFSS